MRSMSKFIFEKVNGGITSTYMKEVQNYPM